MGNKQNHIQLEPTNPTYFRRKSKKQLYDESVDEFKSKKFLIIKEKIKIQKHFENNTFLEFFFEKKSQHSTLLVILTFFVRDIPSNDILFKCIINDMDWEFVPEIFTFNNLNNNHRYSKCVMTCFIDGLCKDKFLMKISPANLHNYPYLSGDDFINKPKILQEDSLDAPLAKILIYES